MNMLQVDSKRCVTSLHSTKDYSAASLFGVFIAGRLDVINSDFGFFTDQLLAEEFTSFVHPRDVIEWSESLLSLYLGAFLLWDPADSNSFVCQQ